MQQQIVQYTSKQQSTPASSRWQKRKHLGLSVGVQNCTAHCSTAQCNRIQYSTVQHMRAPCNCIASTMGTRTAYRGIPGVSGQCLHHPFHPLPFGCLGHHGRSASVDVHCHHPPCASHEGGRVQGLASWGRTAVHHSLACLRVQHLHHEACKGLRQPGQRRTVLLNTVHTVDYLRDSLPQSRLPGGPAPSRGLHSRACTAEPALQ